MELRELRYFVAVAEERSFTRAARRLHLSQQSLSAAVAKLEVRLGGRLLERTTRTVELTPAGKALLAAAPAVLDAADAAVAAARAAAGDRPTGLRVRFGLDSERLVEPLLLAFGRAHPSVRLSGWTGPDVDNLAALRDGRADAVFVWALDGRGGDLGSRLVATTECLLVMPALHPLAGVGDVPRHRVAEHTVVMFPREPVPAVWDRIVAGLGGPADERLHVLPVNGQEAMVRAALRLGALCPVSGELAQRLTAEHPDAAVRRLDPPLTVPLHLAWRHPAPAAVHALAALAAVA